MMEAKLPAIFKKFGDGDRAGYGRGVGDHAEQDGGGGHHPTVDNVATASQAEDFLIWREQWSVATGGWGGRGSDIYTFFIS